MHTTENKKLGRVFLKAGREKSILLGHPWVYSGAVARLDGLDAKISQPVLVCDAKEKVLALALYSAQSQIKCRVLSHDTSTVIDKDFFLNRLQKAKKRRTGIWQTDHCNALRQIFGDADGLSGIIIDQYKDWLVMQNQAAGFEAFKGVLLDALHDAYPLVRGIYEKSDEPSRALEGLEPILHCHKGVLPSNGRLPFKEDGLNFEVDVLLGHKTGFYLDQRDNRSLLRGYCKDKKVLNCFAYTGGFSLQALKGQASSVLSIDSSAQSLAHLEEHLQNNDLATDGRHRNLCADVFKALRDLVAAGESFDVIVLDPPKFVHSKKDMLKALRGYKEINRLAFMLLKDGGHLFSFSCSGLLDQALFQKVLFGAVHDAGGKAFLSKQMLQAADHPILMSCPESLYLKGLLLRKER